MSEAKSYLWDFTSTPQFFSAWNDKFETVEMTPSLSGLYEFCFSDYAESNINDCLNGTTIDTTKVHIIASVDANLIWDGNLNIIKVGDNVTWNIGDVIHPIKAVFLRRKSNGYVLGYCIHNNSFNVTNKVIIPKDTILWSIQQDG